MAIALSASWRRAPTILGRTVFCLHPHQNRFVAPRDAGAVPDVPARRAVLAANMETALNALWDSGCGPADRIVVVGGGIIGLLVAHLAARLPGTEVTLVDVEAERRPVAEALGVRFALPADAPERGRLVFHTSASAAGLDLALPCAGFEAAIVEMSWYGDQAVNVSLGSAFHSKRLRLISSQVGQVALSRRTRWDHRPAPEAAISFSTIRAWTRWSSMRSSSTICRERCVDSVSGGQTGCLRSFAT